MADATRDLAPSSEELLNIWNRDYSADGPAVAAPEQLNFDQNQSDYDLRSYAAPRYTRPDGSSLTPNIDQMLQRSNQPLSTINCNPITPRKRHRNNPPHNPPGCDPPDRDHNDCGHGGHGHGGGDGGGGCQPVPEPATMALFGVAAGVAGLRKRFGRKA
jgi:hypothetical protein